LTDPPDTAIEIEIEEKSAISVGLFFDQILVSTITQVISLVALTSLRTDYSMGR